MTEEVIGVNKEMFLDCIRALTAFVDSTSDSYQNVKDSTEMDPAARRLVMKVLKGNIESVSAVMLALEACMIQPQQINDMTLIN